jgi:hypothetical protein
MLVAIALLITTRKLKLFLEHSDCDFQEAVFENDLQIVFQILEMQEGCV